jgi:hypothetical protein
MSTNRTPSAPRGVTNQLRGAAARIRRAALRSDVFFFALLTGAAVVVGVLSSRNPAWLPPATLVLVLLLGGFLLPPRLLGLLAAVCLGMLVYGVLANGLDVVRPGNILIVLATALIVLAISRSRARLGVQGLRGESMLVDLRDRLRAHGEVPPLPPGWHVEVALRPAYGSAFGGDFVLALGKGDVLELAVVDVSGKGVDAGTRALLLSGAFGGLIGAMEPGEFLPAANAYLLRQHWVEGFATLVHVAIDLNTGSYFLGSAGHPPAVQFDASSGRWSLADPKGPALGVVEDGDYTGVTGLLDHGDALLLYTDGLVELPGREIDDGIDKLVGEAERLVARGFRKGAKRLVDAVAPGAPDDRALVLLWRD